MDSPQEKAKNTKALLLDVDGVLTDGKLYFGNNGEELKAFNIKDGLGIKLLQRSGVQVGIVTGRTSQLVANRANDLGIEIIIQGREDKLAAIKELLPTLGCELNEIAYMGDDLPDLSALRSVGLSMTVTDAIEPIKEAADWVSQFSGGQGAVRQACDYILSAQGKLADLISTYS